jgi:hypothetical protein
MTEPTEPTPMNEDAALALVAFPDHLLEIVNEQERTIDRLMQVWQLFPSERLPPLVTGHNPDLTPSGLLPGDAECALLASKGRQYLATSARPAEIKVMLTALSRSFK